MRVGGNKGMIVACGPNLSFGKMGAPKPNEIFVRPSMTKFESKDRGLHVMKVRRSLFSCPILSAHDGCFADRPIQSCSHEPTVHVPPKLPRSRGQSVPRNVQRTSFPSFSSWLKSREGPGSWSAFRLLRPSLPSAKLRRSPTSPPETMVDGETTLAQTTTCPWTNECTGCRLFVSPFFACILSCPKPSRLLINPFVFLMSRFSLVPDQGSSRPRFRWGALPR
jgi:hypothetical protein